MAALPNDNNNDNNNNNNAKPEKGKNDGSNAANIGNLKQLRIQSGALKRYTKELQYYLKEFSQFKQELQDLMDAEEKEQKKVEIKRQVNKRYIYCMHETQNKTKKS